MGPPGIRSFIDDSDLGVIWNRETDTRVITGCLILMIMGAASQVPLWAENIFKILGIMMCVIAMLSSWAVSTQILISD